MQNELREAIGNQDRLRRLAETLHGMVALTGALEIDRRIVRALSVLIDSARPTDARSLIDYVLRLRGDIGMTAKLTEVNPR